MAGLTAAQLRQFAEQGYLIIEDVLDPARDLRRLWPSMPRCWTASRTISTPRG